MYRAYWLASITEAGRRALASATATAVATGYKDDDRSPSHADVDADAPPAPVELIERLIVSGGVLRVPDPASELRAAWRRAVFTVNASGLVPSGRRLRYAGRSRGDLVIRLEPNDERRQLSRDPSEVPRRPTRLHALLVATRSAGKGQKGQWIDTRDVEGVAHVLVTREQLTRCLDLLNLLIADACRRGHTVSTGRGFNCCGGLTIAVEGHSFEIVVVEEMRRTAPVATSHRAPRSSSAVWRRIAGWDLLPTGRLRMQVAHHQYGSQLAADRKRFTLEDRLGAVLDALERRAAEAAAEELEAERARADDDRACEVARAAATAELTKNARVAHLEEQVRRWRLARDVEALVTAVFTARSPSDEEQRWATWALDYADELDPSLHGFHPPVEH